VLAADGINIYSNNEACAEQIVFHTHIHIIPRYDKRKNLTHYKENIEEYYNKIKVILEREQND